MRIVTARLRRYPQSGGQKTAAICQSKITEVRNASHTASTNTPRPERETKGANSRRQRASRAREQLSRGTAAPAIVYFPRCGSRRKGRPVVKARGIRGMKPRPRRRIPPPRYGEDKEARRGRLRVTLKKPLLGPTYVSHRRREKARCLLGKIEMETIALSPTSDRFSLRRARGMNRR